MTLEHQLGPMALPPPGWITAASPFVWSRPDGEGPRPVPHDAPRSMRATYGERRAEVTYYDGAFMAVVDGQLVAREDSRRVAAARVEDYLALRDGKHLEWEA